jgi:hypothetical protein
VKRPSQENIAATPGAETTGKNLSNDIGNINNVSEAFLTPLTVLFYELYGGMPA